MEPQAKVGYVVGVFDMFHIGHIRLIDRALSKCKKLVIGVHTDEFVAQYKRVPTYNEKERKQAITAYYGDRIKFVEIVGSSHKDVITRHNVTHMYHGDDWDMDGYKRQIRYEEDALGVEIVLLPYTQGVSTTQLTRKVNALKYVHTVFFDLDNTLLVDGNALPGAADCLKFLRHNNCNLKLVTNNNRYTPTQIIAILASAGIIFSDDEVISSLTQIRDYLILKGITDAYVWGSADAAHFLGEHTTHDVANASLIIVAYHDSYTYQDLVQIVTKIANGTPYVVGNIDDVYPSRMAILPDAGTVAATIQKTTGKNPLKVFGKPYMNLQITDTPSRYLIVGDTLSTDGELAKNNSIEFFQVTDVTTLQTLHNLFRVVHA